MDHPPRFQVNNEEDKDRAEKQVVGLHKIAGPNLVGMVLQERCPGLPGLTRWQVLTCLLHVLADGAFAHPVTQFAQFIADLLGTPSAILKRYLLDQGDGFGRNSWAAGFVF